MLAKNKENIFLSVVEDAYKISLDTGKQVEKILEDGLKNPLSEEQERQLLHKAISFIRKSAKKKGDSVTSENLDGDIDEIVEKIVSRKKDKAQPKGEIPTAKKRIVLIERNGIKPGPVKPTPRFYMREIPMNCGYVKTSDINLWGENVRLDIHLGQFKSQYARDPRSDELLQIMLSNIKLPGLQAGKDEFDIKALAHSIAANGVRVPPIIDIDGKLLDGNRRVTACNYILHSDEFSSEQKRKVEYLFVRQLTEHASDDDRHSVIVSLNFEDDLKKSWPEYVKARQVYVEWESMLATEPRRPGPQREREMKRELSDKFALGNVTRVNRYIKMVEWATSFEDYFSIEKEIDPYQVKHKANEYFQYFDELSKGAVNEGGVAYTLDRDEKLKKLIFDLLYQDKIKNFTLIRDIKYVGLEDRDQLTKALDLPADEDTEDYVEKILSDARARSKESRVVGANQRINAFVTWLEKLPIGSFDNPEEINTESLVRLTDALKLAERLVKPALEKRHKKK